MESKRPSLLKVFKYHPVSKGFWTLLSYPFATFLYSWIYWIEKTSSVEIQGSGAHYQGSAIYVNWHQHIPLLVHHHGAFARWILVSSAPYMEPIVRWCEFAGLRIIRGASGEKSKEAFDQMKDLLEQQSSLNIAVDGPAGPIYQVKKGCVELARATGVPIIPVSYRSKRARPFPGRWDLSLIPGFFDQIFIEYGEPYFILTDVSTEEALIRIKESLNALKRGKAS